MGLNLRSLLLAAFVISNSITWTASRHHFTHNIHGHRTRHRRQGAGLYLPSSFVIPGGAGSGPWGDWGETSSCSRTCGGGVASQKRICLGLAADGRATCTGGDTKYFSCETAECPAGAADFRAAQCSEYDDVPFRGIKHKWIPYTNGPKECELNCMPKGERFYYRHKAKVTDGTLCGTESYNVCVDGTCQPVGCDMMLGSKAREDKCRRCRGDGSSCRTITGRDTQEFIKGYNDVLRIPEGATNIFIGEVRESSNYLALHTPADAVNGTRYLLNGDYHIDFPRALTIAGATWHYERRQQGFAAPDRLRCLGPTTEPLILSLLVQDENVGIDYEYSVPTSLAPPIGARYGWVFSQYTPCSVSCGIGFQTRNVTCRSLTDPAPLEEVVSETLCDADLKPPSNSTCDMGDCPAEWVPGPWSPCTKPCGEGGSRQREVHCEKVITNGVKFNFRSTVSEEECFRLLGPPPALHEECNKESVCPTWFTGPWKPCDQLCDEGQQTRQVVCHLKRDGRVEVLPDGACADEKPSARQPCMLHPCEGVDWVLSDWTGCDNCLSKVKSREVQCSTKHHEVVDDNFCANHLKPNLTEPCKPQDLPDCQAQWYATQWSNCSVECGKGVKTRLVFCGLFNGKSVVTVNDSECKTEKYKDSTPCEIPPEKCPAKWFTGPWSACTKPCGGGERFRKAMCLSGGRVATCNNETMPDTTESCNIGSCDIDNLLPVNANATPVIDKEPEDVEYCEEELDGDEVGAELDGDSVSGFFSDGPGDGSTFSTDYYSTTWTGSTETGSGDMEITAESTTDFTETFETDSTLSTVSGSTDSTEESTGSEAITESGATDVTSSTDTATYSDLTEVTETGTSDATSSTDSTLAGSDSTEVTGTETTDDTSSTDSTLAASDSTEVTGTETTDDTSSTDSTLAGSDSTEVTGTETTDDTSSTDSTLAGSDSTEVTGTGTTDDTSSTDSTLAGSDSTEVTETGTTDAISSTDSTLAGSDSTEVTGTGTTDDTSTTDSTLASSGSTEVTETGTTDATSSTDSTMTGSDSSEITETVTTDSTEVTESTDTSGSTEATETTESEASTVSFASSVSDITETGSTESTVSTEDTSSTVTENTASTVTDETGSTGTDGKDSTETDITSQTTELTGGSSTTEAGSTSDTSSSGSESSLSTTEGITGSSPDSSALSTTETTDSTTDETGSTVDTTDTVSESDITDITETTESGITETSEGTTESVGTGSTDVTGSTEVTETGSTDVSTTEVTSESGPTETSESEGTEATGSTTESSSTTEYTGSEDTSETGESTLWDWTSTLATTTKKQCVPRHAMCRRSSFGCCPDNKTAAAGPFDEGCPTPKTCKETRFGCCPDGVSPASRARGKGCPPAHCELTLFGCCRSDNSTPAEGNDQEGCPPPPPACRTSEYGCCKDDQTEATGLYQQGCPETTTTTEAPEVVEEEGCTAAEFGCCYDNVTEAAGPDGRDCPCNATKYGCCPDDVTPATGLDLEGCADCKEHGCCDDNKTPAHGPNGLGCCLLHAYGCCPDNYKPATGPNLEGCECQGTQFGCCPDNVTIARGANKEGCGCQYSEHGCCEDRHTAATGPNKEGCSCHTYQFGCCPDGVTVVKGLRLKGCHCRESAYKCCGDGVTPAAGPDGEGCDCASSQYGCCPDGQTAATGTKFEGCPDIPINQQAACSLPKDRGTRKPGVSYEKFWYYDMQYAGCSTFYYFGAGGNGNRFPSKEICEDICVHPRDVCLLPKVAGSDCAGSYRRWYYDANHEQCIQFMYTGCLGNKNNFESRELCEAQCQPNRDRELCVQTIERGECSGNFERWGYDVATGRCRVFQWGGCGGSDNRFGSEAACMLRCRPPGERQTECTQPQEPGNCDEKIPAWSFNASESRCVPFYYTGCEGNANRFADEQSCAAACPPVYDKQRCELPAVAGDCSNYELKWYYDLNTEKCTQFYYGGCGGNDNQFDSEQECQSSCAGASSTTTTTTPTPREDNIFKPEYCFLEKESGPCSGNETRWAYSPSRGDCEIFRFGGCAGNRNNFPSREYCRRYCHSVQDVCQLPMKTGGCDASVPRWFYDAASDRCSQFAFSGCDGNENNFESAEDCERRCRTGPAPGPEPEPTPEPRPDFTTTTVPPIPPECQVYGLERCRGVGHAWYLDPDTRRCTVYNAPAADAPGEEGCDAWGVFPSPEACERKCGEFVGIDVCRQPPNPGSCSENQPKFYFDIETRACLPFTYGGCHGGPNRFSTIDECEDVCKPVKDPCQQPPDRGNCIDFYEMWYHDPESNDCKPLAYTGCGGNQNRFNSREHCEALCVRRPAPPAPAPPTTTPRTELATPAPPAPPVDEECRAPESLEPCGPPVPAFYFDAARGACAAAPIGACRYAGSWRSEEECERRCGEFTDVEDVCLLPLDPGSCRDRPVNKVYWDTQEQRCRNFTYGGCDGNANRFSSFQECTEVCAHLASDPCQQPPDRGNCIDFYEMWYHDPESNDCKPLAYTGCGGNQNRFNSREHCEALCVRRPAPPAPAPPTTTPRTELATPAPPAPPVDEECRAPESLEPCGPPLPAFYFDAARGACAAAPIGACRYAGSWRSEEECERRCGEFKVINDVCRMPLDPGPCRDSPANKFYWDMQELRCKSFTYGGCGGGANRFSSFQECEEECAHLAPDPACRLPAAEGAACAGAGARAGERRWAYSALHGECRPLLYLGCGGNDNNFLTFQQCASLCSPSPDDNRIFPDIQDCRAARDVCAALQCEHGVQRVLGADGCENCTCIVREPDCTMLEAECANITCSYGPNITRDADGCRRCGCLRHPCEGLTCAEGQQCAVTAERDPVTQDVRYGAECRINIQDCRAARDACAALQCEHGVQRVRSADGCENCTCIVREPDCTMLEAECANITCSYGPNITRDADGCRRCGCLRHPCEGLTCAEGQRCVVTVERDPVTQDVRYGAECRIRSKEGACPAEDPPAGGCRRECRDDADCRGTAKCCAAGCSHLCRAPVAPDVDEQVVERAHAPQPDPHTEREVAAQEGGLATLRCLFHSNPPPKITWRRGEITIDGDKDRYRITSDGALEIVSLYRNDSGVYICIAENNLGRTQQEVVLRVNNPSQQAAGIAGPPETDVVGEVGRPLSIRCLVFGYPTPSISWSRGPTGPMVPYYSEQYEARGHVLLIRALDVAALGLYTCQAYNGIDKPALWTVTVRAPRRDPAWPASRYLLLAPEQRTRGPVISGTAPVATTTPPTPPTQSTQSTQSVQSNLIEIPYVPYTDPVRTALRPATTTLAAGAELSLPCEVDGYPEPEVHWTKDGAYLEPSDRLELTAARLTLRDLTVADSGEYGCHARNEFTSHSSSVAITVQELTIPAHCTDNQFFANCQLIVRSKFCNHKYYSTFCCKSCVEAGLLNPQNLQLQADQSWMKK